MEDVRFEAISGTITDYNATSRNIVIPEYFNVNGIDVPIISIDENAFENCAQESLTISNGIKSISKNAFIKYFYIRKNKV